MLKFEVIEDYDLKEFETTVQQYLKDGWQLHGTLIAFPNYVDEGKVESVRYVQALTKLERGQIKVADGESDEPYGD